MNLKYLYFILSLLLIGCNTSDKQKPITSGEQTQNMQKSNQMSYTQYYDKLKQYIENKNYDKALHLMDSYSKINPFDRHEKLYYCIVEEKVNGYMSNQKCYNELYSEIKKVDRDIPKITDDLFVIGFSSIDNKQNIIDDYIEKNPHIQYEQYKQYFTPNFDREFWLNEFTGENE